MNKKVFGVLAVLLLAMFGVVVNGQSLYFPLHVNIPFAFSADDKTLPKGEYTVETANIRGAVVIRSQHDSVMILSQPTEERTGRTADELVFHYVDGKYFLHSIWTADNSVGFGFAPTRHEKELLSAGAIPELKVVVASAAH